MSHTQQDKGLISTLSESSNIRLGLALTVLGGVIYLVTSVHDVRETIRHEMENRYVSKELFTVRMNSLEQTSKDRMDSLDKQIGLRFEQLFRDVATLKEQVRGVSSPARD